LSPLRTWNNDNELAEKIAAGPPVAHRLAKMMMYRGLEMDLDTAMQMAAAAESITLSSADHAEGLAAAREGLKPEYRGA
jgi:enoyl-CoA hydratase/carnithine racemase